MSFKGSESCRITTELRRQINLAPKPSSCERCNEVTRLHCRDVSTYVAASWDPQRLHARYR